MAFDITALETQLLTDIETTSIVDATASFIGLRTTFPNAWLEWRAEEDLEQLDLNGASRHRMPVDIIAEGDTKDQVNDAIHEIQQLWYANANAKLVVLNSTSGVIDIEIGTLFRPNLPDGAAIVGKVYGGLSIVIVADDL